VPERKLGDDLLVPPHTDKGLPATIRSNHVQAPADFPAGGISNVPGILMKQADRRAVALAVWPSRSRRFLSDRPLQPDASQERNLHCDGAWLVAPGGLHTPSAPSRDGKVSAGERAAFADAFKGGNSKSTAIAISLPAN